MVLFTFKGSFLLLKNNNNMELGWNFLHYTKPSKTWDPVVAPQERFTQPKLHQPNSRRELTPHGGSLVLLQAALMAGKFFLISKTKSSPLVQPCPLHRVNIPVLLTATPMSWFQGLLFPSLLSSFSLICNAGTWEEKVKKWDEGQIKPYLPYLRALESSPQR